MMMNKLMLAAFATVCAGTVLSAGTAEAARSTCKKVYLSAVNQTGGVVKVIDLDYHIRGYGRKSEPIRNQEIPNGRNWAAERNLEQASGRSLYIEVKYRTRKTKGLGKWSKIQRAYSSASECKDRGAYQVVMK